MKKVILSLSIVFIALLSNAQNGLDSVIVEKYYVSTASDIDATDTVTEGALPIGSVTYRVFLSLKPGYAFFALYGSDTLAPAHPTDLGRPKQYLIVKTSSPNFFNNKDRGSQYADGITRTSYLNSYNVALDSWFSVGAAVNGQFGVLKSKDDGANNYIFPHSPTGMLSNTLAPVGIPLSVQDGIVSGGRKSPCQTNGTGDADINAQNVFGGNGTGNLFVSRNGGIYVSSGSGGRTTGPPADSTRVLIGQFTTDGVFEFELNVQIIKTDSNITQYFVARNSGSNNGGREITIPSLIYRSLTTAMNAPAFVLKDSLATLRVNTTGNGHIDSVEFFVDGTKVGTDRTFPYSYNWKGTVLGTHILTSAAIEHDGTRVASSPITITVTSSFPIISIISPVNTAEFLPGSVVAITTNVSESGNGTVDSIVFFMDGIKLGTDINSPYTYTLITNTNGTHTITAVAVDNKMVRATSSPIIIAVGTKFPPTVSILSPATTSSYEPGDMVSITANATEVGGDIDSVLFFVDGTRIGVDSIAPYSINWQGNTPGTYTLRAMAFDSALADTISRPVIIGVRGPLMVSILNGVGTYAVDSIISIKANASEVGGAIDSVVFFVDGMRIGKDPTSPYSVNWTTDTPDTYTLTAMAFDSTSIDSTSRLVIIMVKNAPVINITAPISAATTYSIGSSVSINAIASEQGGSINYVKFFIDGQSIGYAFFSPYSINWVANTSGTHTLTAVAFDYNSMNSTSLPILILVKGPPVISITAPVSAAKYTTGSMVSITADASEFGGVIDSVVFFVDGTRIGNDFSSPYSFNWSANTAGTYTLTAMAFDAVLADTTSLPVLIVVNNLPVISITSPANTATYTVGSKVSITASSSESGGTIDSVAFFVDGVKIENDSISPYIINWTSTVGTHTLTAIATDNNGAHTTSDAVIITISPVTGINDIITTSLLFTVYPNPVRDYITIEISAIVQNNNVSYAVYDVYGNVLLNKKIGNINSTYKEVMDISSFSTGLYIIKMVSDQLTVTKKIIIN